MEKNKIGILTFHRADNSGAVLQAYALQETLENEFSADAEIIDYRCDKIEQTRGIRRGNGLKESVKNIFKAVYYYIKRRGFNRFRKERLKVSDKIYNRENIIESLKCYETFIAGSDQIWNLECSGSDTTYFLDFVQEDKKKISFSASIGNCVFGKKDEKNIAQLIKALNGVSVREKSAVSKLESIGINDIAILPDPVFLLSAEEWESVMKKRIHKGKYVLVYLIQDDTNISKNAYDYAKKHGLKLINNKKSIEFILHNSPDEFLSWIYYAECIFTNSFHGTAFSVLFGKRLIAERMLKNGEINERVNELLENNDSEDYIINARESALKFLGKYI